MEKPHVEFTFVNEFGNKTALSTSFEPFVTVDDMMEAFGRFLLGCGYHPVSIAGSASDWAEELRESFSLPNSKGGNDV